MVVNTSGFLGMSAPPVISRLMSFYLIFLLLACINGVAGADNFTNPIAVYKSVRSRASLTDRNSASQLWCSKKKVGCANIWAYCRGRTFTPLFSR